MLLSSCSITIVFAVFSVCLSFGWVGFVLWCVGLGVYKVIKFALLLEVVCILHKSI